MNFTPQQNTAVFTHDRNLIVAAGAGSGKTRVLVERYLALLDAHPDWQLNALVAITFTRKAAQEMRDRVRATLEQRLANAADTGTAAAWSARIAQMDSARIDTIHALCADLLRANAAEAGIDPDFVVLDEQDTAILLDEVIDDTLRQIAYAHDPTTRLFAEYDRAAVRDTLRDAVALETVTPPDDLLAHWHAHWHADADSALLRWQDELATRDRYTPIGTDALSTAWQTCAACLERLAAAASVADRLDAAFTLADIRKPGKPHADWGETGAQAKAALVHIIDGAKHIRTAFGVPLGTLDERAADLLVLWAALITRVQAAYRQVKETNGWLDFDDLETLTRRLLDDAPHVAARYRGAEFQHLLVDEFQDTNAAQWAIVQALGGLDLPGSLFVVGDAKQSIYAFRGADVSVFAQVQDEIVRRGGARIDLPDSFRAHQPLADCFNHLFAHVLVKGDDPRLHPYEIAYETPMIAWRAHAPSDAPPLELLCVDKTDSNADEARRIEAHQLTERLRTLVEDERRPVYDRHTGELRPVGYGDIALLFQSMTSVTLYEDAFKSAGLPFVTVAGRGYYSRQEVWDLLNLLRALYNPSDDLALAAVLRSPMFTLSDDALLGLRLLSGTTDDPPRLSDALTDAALGVPVLGMDAADSQLAVFAYEVLYELRLMAGRMTIAELLREALAKTGYLATLTGLPDGARRRGNVEKLLDKAQQGGRITLGAFSAYLTEMSEREAREGETTLDSAGAVTLMTVHKSKGLEFPVVVLVDSSRSRGGRRAEWLTHDPTYGLACKVYDEAERAYAAPYVYRRAVELAKAREDAEHRRLFYVAATRAQDYLIVSGQTWRDKRENRWTSDGWLRWLIDTLDLSDLPAQPTHALAAPWGALHVTFTTAAGEPPPRPDADGAWDIPAIASAEPLPDTPPSAPPLVGAVPVERDAPARSLTATQIADLGSIYATGEGESRLYWRRLRRALLHAAPAHIELVSARQRRVTQRRIGEIVHKALRWWRFPTGSAQTALLRSYAWEQGIVDPVQQEQAIDAARRALAQIQQSDVYEWINTAQRVYHELPFVFQTDRRAVYGVIDVLIQRQDGTWAIIDYKTAHVRHLGKDTALAAHARRYHLQLGVYAAAVADFLHGAGAPEDVVPDVFIHYIQDCETIAVSRAEWEAALARLESWVGDFLGQPAAATTE